MGWGVVGKPHKTGYSLVKVVVDVISYRIVISLLVFYERFTPQSRSSRKYIVDLKANTTPGVGGAT